MAPKKSQMVDFLETSQLTGVNLYITYIVWLKKKEFCYCSFYAKHPKSAFLTSSKKLQGRWSLVHLKLDMWFSL